MHLKTYVGATPCWSDKSPLSSVGTQAKQKWHITLDRSFPATANLRNEAMMHEAADFAVHLKRCEKDIRTLKNATEGDRNPESI